MKRKINFITLLLIAGTLTKAGNLVGFGDSLSDTGNVARFTYNSGKLYNEHIASYLGEDFKEPDGGARTIFETFKGEIPPSLVGPNFAQGGATANTDLGIESPFGGFIKLQSQNQIDQFFNLNPKKENFKNMKVIYWIGGNDMRLVSKVSDEKKVKDTILKSSNDIENQIKKLNKKGINFMIIPTVPDISYTPKFFKQFATTYKIDGKNLFKEKSGWFSFLSSGLSIDNLNKLLDEPEKRSENFDNIIKDTIKKLLIMQKQDSSKENIDKWYTAYKNEREKLSKISDDFNLLITQKIDKIQKENPNLKVLRPDVSELIKEVAIHPKYYGFTNITGSACKTFGDALANPLNLGKGSGRDRIASFEPEDNMDGKANLEKKELWGKGYHYLFADEFHPSPEAHKIMADYMISLFESEDQDIFDDSINYNQKINLDQSAIIKAKEKDIKNIDGKDKIYKKGYVPMGAINAKNGGKINFKNLSLENDGISILAQDMGTKVEISNFNIKNMGRISSAIEVENGANVILDNGNLRVIRGSKISYPFGARINGKNTKINLNNSKINVYGKKAVGMSVGNKAMANIINSEIKGLGEKTKSLQLFDGIANLDNSNLKADTGIWIFANSNNDKSIVNLNKSTIDGKNYAIKIAPNITNNNSIAYINSNSSQINGRIFTKENSISILNMQNSLWNMNNDSNLNILNLDNSKIYFSKDNNFHKLHIDNDYMAQNSELFMKGNISKDNLKSDVLAINGNITGKTYIYYKNLANESVSIKDKIKIIDSKNKISKDAFKLKNSIYAGNYEYVLFNNPNYFYLTSNIMDKNNNTIYLYRPKIAFESMIPYANMQASFDNIFHIKDRNEIYFNIQNNYKKLAEKNKNEIEIKSNNMKLSYPMSDNYGVFFSISTSNMKLNDNIRLKFNKDSYIGSLKRKDYNIGTYFTYSIKDKVYFDNTLQYEFISNKYNVEDKDYKANGYGIGASSLVRTPFKINDNLEFNTYYQIDLFKEKIKNQNYNAIKNRYGADISYKQEKFKVLFGIEKENNLKNIKRIKINNENFKHNYENNDINYKFELEIKPKENLKLFGNVKFNDIKRPNYGLGFKILF